MYDLAAAVIPVCIVLLVFMAYAPVRFRFRQIRAVWLLLTAALGIFAFYSSPSPGCDLYRHYELVRQMQQGAGDTGYGAVYGFLFLCRLAAWLGDPGWLPMTAAWLFGLFVDGAAAGYVKKHHAGHRAVILYYFFVFSCTGVFSIISGIRNALVCAMVMYAYENYYVRGRWRYYLICLLACTVHIIGVLLVCLIFVYSCLTGNRKAGRKLAGIVTAVIALRVSISSGAVSYAASRIPGAYGSLLYTKINGYLADGNGSGAPLDTVQLFMLLNYVLLVFLLAAAGKKRYECGMLPVFIMLVALAGTGLPVIRGRLLMFTGLSGLPVLDTVSAKSGRTGKWMVVSVCLLVCGMEILYSSYSMFSHMQFHGHDYRAFILRLAG